MSYASLSLPYPYQGPVWLCKLNHENIKIKATKAKPIPS